MIPSRVKLTLLFVSGLLALGAATATLAYAEEFEAPFWKVGGARLGAGETKGFSLKFASGSKAVLRTKIAGTNIEEVCSVVVTEENAWRGSEPHTDGKVITRITYENCVLLVENSKKEFEEVKACKDEPVTMSLEGKLWYEGPEKEHKQTIVALLKAPVENIVAKQEIVGEGCIFKGTYNLEGDVAARVKPENEQAKTGEVIFPEGSIGEVWQPQEGGTAEAPALTFDKAKATFEAKFVVEGTAKEEFGAFS
jgi:hypothetical protein